MTTTAWVTIDDVFEAVAASVPFDAGMLRSDFRGGLVVEARRAFALVARELARATYPDIARMLTGRSHASSWWQVRRAEERIQTDPAFAELVDEVRTRAQAIAEARLTSPRPRAGGRQTPGRADGVERALPITRDEAQGTRIGVRPPERPFKRHP